MSFTPRKIPLNPMAKKKYTASKKPASQPAIQPVADVIAQRALHPPSLAAAQDEPAIAPIAAVRPTPLLRVPKPPKVAQPKTKAFSAPPEQPEEQDIVQLFERDAAIEAELSRMGEMIDQIANLQQLNDYLVAENKAYRTRINEVLEVLKAPMPKQG